MKLVRRTVRNLTSQELGFVNGGMDLEGRRLSTNVYVQVREGNVVYTYDHLGRCVKVEISVDPG